MFWKVGKLPPIGTDKDKLKELKGNRQVENETIEMIVISIFSYITPQYQKLISIFVFYHYIQIRQDNFIKISLEILFFLF